MDKDEVEEGVAMEGEIRVGTGDDDDKLIEGGPHDDDALAFIFEFFFLLYSTGRSHLKSVSI